MQKFGSPKLLGIAILWLALSLSFAMAQESEARLMRFPTANATEVTFTYAGDLYTVSRKGGVARRMTSHVGFEMFAKYAPDGKTLAFSAQYDGNTEVYTMPAQGGTPKRITWTATLDRDDVADRMGPNNMVLGWQPDGKQIVYRSRGETFNDWKGQLYTAPLAGGLSEQLPFSVGSWCSYEAGGKRIAHNRLFREFRTWKYYRGGQADDIWIFNFANGSSENITNSKAQDIMPMWHKDRIYFLSDRDRTMNLFCYDLNTKQTRKVTNFTDFDIKFPSLGPDVIAFEQAGYIWLFNLETEVPIKLSITIQEDYASGRNPIVDASKHISDYDLSPDGKRALFVARGDVWTAPANSGVLYNLTESPSAHERDAVWSPKGDLIAYISDESGENEIWVMKPDGSDKRQLTKNTRTYMYAPQWSPNGKKIAWTDKELWIQYVDVASGVVTEVDKAESWEIRRFKWSPDSRWLAYNRPEWMSASRIMVHELGTGKNLPVSNAWFDASDFAWSPEGLYLYYSANTEFNPIYSWTEWNTAFQDMQRPYLVCLAKDTPNPFAEENEQVSLGSEQEEKAQAKKAAAKGKDTAENGTEVNVRIDFEDIVARTVALPGDLSGGSYYGMSATADGLYYYYSNASSDTKLFFYDLDKEKHTELGKPKGYTRAAQANKMLIKENDSYYVIDLPKSAYQTEKAINLSGMQVQIDQAAEWKQVFHETWRQMRDFFYDPNMHGVNWKAMRDKYVALLPHVNHRKDLTYILGELIGELNVGHAYVGGGAQPSVSKVKMGLLGAELSPDKSGFVRIDRILQGANWSDTYRSPLAAVGSDIKAGEYIVAVNGKSVADMQNIGQALMGKADTYVELSISEKPNLKGARKVMVKPIAQESDLRYYDWVQNNIRKVSEATNGQVGYLHVPDMGPAGLKEFVKHFYPQLNKKALIIDDRGNGGGNVSPMLIERLRRELDMVTFSRNTKPGPSPSEMLVGPKVLLIDRYSASDGDLFPYRFKFHELGTIIGERSWGGTVGIRGSLPLVDGGTLTKPEFSRYDVTGKEWIIEGYGVDPHIEVIQDPHLEFKGQDLQLEKAIEVVLEKMKTQPTELPAMPSAFPDKSK